MSTTRNPVYYSSPRGDFKQVLGHGIARYGFFSFVNSDRVTSDMGPYVQSNLPPQLRNLTATYAAQKQSPRSKRGMKKRLMIRFLQLFPAAVQSFQKGSQFMMNPFVAMTDVLNGKTAGKNEIAQDRSWGTATVKTDSLQGDLLWSTPVSLGSSSQTLKVNIDTGSSDFLVLDPACTTCGLTSRAAFLYQKSTSFTALINLTFTEIYADGAEANGYLAKDVLDFGDEVKIPNQVFGLATDLSSHWQTSPVDGLMGLGPDSLSTFPEPNNHGVFTQLIENNALANPVVGIALAKAAQNSSGEFSFGKISSRWIRGGVSQMVWKNVTSQNFWGTDLSGIYVNNRNIMVSGDPPRAIVDTGTSLMLVTTSAAAAIHAQIPGAIINPDNGIWRLPCSTGVRDNILNAPKPASSSMQSLLGTAFSIFGNSQRNNKRHHRSTAHSRVSSRAPTPPSIFIELGAGIRKFGIPASDLSYQAIPSDDSNSVASDGRTAMCYSSIQSGADGFVVLGGTFIKNHYIALKRDGSKRSIGFGDRSDLPVIS